MIFISSFLGFHIIPKWYLLRFTIIIISDLTQEEREELYA